MTNNIILHVGLHKTATTFLQANVWPGLTGYTYLSRPYTQHNHAFNQLQYADDSLYSKQLVVDEINKIKPSKLLISDESLSGKPIFLSYLNRSVIAKRLKDLFPEATIVLFIRDQKDIMASHYNSYVKMPYGKKKIQHFFWRPKKDYSYDEYLHDPTIYQTETLYYNTNDYFLHFDCFLYSLLLECYTKLFENVQVFLYEDFKRDKNSTFARLEEITGEKLAIHSESRKNKSLSKNRLEARRKANMYTNNSYIRTLLESVLQIKSSGSDLHRIISEFVDDYYLEDNKLLKMLLPSLPWDKFPNKYKS